MHAVWLILLWTAVGAGLVAPPARAVVPSLSTDLVGKLCRSDATISWSLSELQVAADGLSVWRLALASGRVPDWDGVDMDASPWPEQPLRSTLSDTIIRIGLPRTTARHPSLIPAALAAVWQATLRFGDALDAMALDSVTPSEEVAQFADDTSEWFDFDEEYEAQEEEEEVEVEEVEEDVLATVAQEVADALATEWSAPLRGVRAVETLGGADGGDAGSLTVREQFELTGLPRRCLALALAPHCRLDVRIPPTLAGRGGEHVQPFRRAVAVQRLGGARRCATAAAAADGADGADRRPRPSSVERGHSAPWCGGGCRRARRALCRTEPAGAT